MSEILRYSNTCSVKQSGSGKVVEGVVYDFKDKDRLVVVLNQSVKLSMKWNGRVYEGAMAGLDFVSDGPRVNRTQTSMRG